MAKRYKIIVDEKEFSVEIAEETLGTNSECHKIATVAAVPEKETPIKASAPVNDGKEVKSPMPGTILKIKAANGSSVVKGEPLLILEAMKMENEIVAPEDGTVNIAVAEGDKVNSGDIIARIS